jgi:uncharacterized protein YndB with AHSA1/START domain
MPPEAERPVADDELLITRIFDAPVALVFKLWAEREHLVRWFGPRNFTCTHLEMDFRPGGAWRACIMSDSYGERWMSGRYQTIEPERRIVTSFAWEQPHGQLGHENLVTVTFAEQDGRTVQTFHQAPFRDVAARDAHVRGWSSALDSEQAYLERLTQGEQS